MLTNLFYYNFYKPYRISGTTSRMAAAPASKIKTPEVKEELMANSEIHKNFALKDEVVNYARNFSHNVVGLKDASKTLTKNSGIIMTAAHAEGLGSAIDWADEDLAEFTDTFNELKEFAKNQTHSRAVANLTEDISNDLFENTSLLSSMGVVMTEDGYLDYSRDRIELYSYSELSEALENAKELGQVIYNKTSNFLQKPLAEHMRFRPMNYYYNYKLGALTHNPFQLIETGMIVDVSV